MKEEELQEEEQDEQLDIGHATCDSDKPDDEQMIDDEDRTHDRYTLILTLPPPRRSSPLNRYPSCQLSFAITRPDQHRSATFI